MGALPAPTREWPCTGVWSHRRLVSFRDLAAAPLADLVAIADANEDALINAKSKAPQAQTFRNYEDVL